MKYPLNPDVLHLGFITLTWYAVFIFVGALLSYFTAQHIAKKHGYKKEILLNCFYLVFPMGILGSRIWYVIANYHEYKDVPFFDPNVGPLAIWNGGLAIQGGVILGAIAGVWYFMHYFPKENKRFWADLIIPNILIAQAIGRWGNFMNNEVFGVCTQKSNLWWVPDFIIKQLQTATISSGQACNVSAGAVPLPLFLIEFLINTFGFFLITWFLRNYWHKGKKPGDLGALYFVWYGAVRLILEGFRMKDFIMTVSGEGLGSTYVLSGIMVAFGLGWLVVNRIIKDPPVKDNYEYFDVLEKIEEQVENGN
ncbi:MAG: prolipoprotein diacylglyceryl transferase [Bacillales bacterium]|jgi:phosphatidylglycerol:prolipoprotein diacylglycerol transferase|nr:prolipoprotein diacylglyceryl transferase [Bacillales bacterium]